jgi:uncharacterized protein (TIGR02271 family)
MPLAEEELSAERKTREAGRVTLKKDVVTEEKTIKVPVTREEVRVERTPVSAGEARTGEGTFEKSAVTIPVHEEEIEVTKRPVVKEEVRVTKTPYTEQRTASETVRKEVADVEEEGDIRRAPNLESPDLKKT